MRLLSDRGQAYIKTIEAVIKKPSNQDVVIQLFKTIREYFSAVRPNDVGYDDIETLLSDVNKYVEITANQTDELKEVIDISPELSSIVKSAFVLSLIDEPLLTPIFSRTDAIGSLMRKKIDHITSPILKELSVLRYKA